MKTLTFVRHGESTANAGGLTMPHAEIPLSAKGRAQAEAVADLLPANPAAIRVSAFSRAMATAAPYALRTGVTPTAHPDLHEFSAIDPDLLQGMTGIERRPIADAYWQAAERGRRMGPAAETFDEFDRRVESFLRGMPALEDGTVLFGHGIWFGLLCWKLMGFADYSPSMRAFRRFQSGLPLPNCAVYQLTHVGNNAWHVRFARQLDGNISDG